MDDRIHQLDTVQDLRTALVERQVLFTELQHRTHNTMHMISAFLVLQASRATSSETRDALLDVLRRVNALNVAERALHRLEELDRVKLGIFLPAILTELMNLEDRPGIRLETTIEHDVETSVSQGQALGLVVSEIAINALKHAFPQGQGVLSLRLRGLEEGRAQIEVSDDGIGWPEVLEAPRRPGSIGLRLLQALTRQAEAELSFDGSQGLRAVVQFAPFQAAPAS